jgi:hypothetical protein
MKLRYRAPRQKSEKHLAWIRTLPCLVCKAQHTCEAAHVRFSSRRHGKRAVGIGEKPDDKWAVPLCRSCHADQHRHNEREWWVERKIDPVTAAEKLWRMKGDGIWAIEFIRTMA